MDRIDLTDSVDKLAALIKTDASKIDQELAAEGASLLAVFTDTVMAGKNKTFPLSREVAIRDAIDDLANGGQILARGSIGVKYEDGMMVPFLQLNEDQVQINAAYSLRFKKTAAFRAWREEGPIEIPQEQLNACIYFLVTQLVGA